MAIFVNIPGGEDFADINDDRAGARIGERIKKIREAREMTRAELGALIGLDQNRIQQYETGRRKPKLQLLKMIASALGVETIALMDPMIESYVGAMHTLFQMEEKLGIKILKGEDGYHLQFGDGKSDGMNRYLSKWYEVRQEMMDVLPDMTDEERKKKVFDYNMFQWTYPAGISAKAHRKYDEHPINRMQEIHEDEECSKHLLEELENNSDLEDDT